MDEDGFYYIVDRWKDMYISGGENVYPAEVERVLAQIDVVLEVAVIGVPDPKWGEVGKAFIVLKEGMNASSSEILDHCRENLAKYKIPTQISFVPELPHTPSGKIMKHALKSASQAAQPVDAASEGRLMSGSEGRLSNRVALVTGAGRGIGRATALKLAREGAALAINDVDAEPLEETAEEIREIGRPVASLASDITAPGFSEQFTGLAVEQLGGLDIIVANAGYAWNSPLSKHTDEQWDVMISTHATSNFRLVRAALPHFANSRRRSNRQCKVVFVSSIAAVYGAASMTSYAAAKGAVIGMTRSLSQELGPDAINVNAVAFGFTDTRLTRPVQPGEDAAVQVADRMQRLGYKASSREAVIDRIALGRPGTADEAAGAVWFLCVPESDYVTGQVLICSGGLYT